MIIFFCWYLKDILYGWCDFKSYSFTGDVVFVNFDFGIAENRKYIFVLFTDFQWAFINKSRGFFHEWLTSFIWFYFIICLGFLFVFFSCCLNENYKIIKWSILWPLAGNERAETEWNHFDLRTHKKKWIPAQIPGNLV